MHKYAHFRKSSRMCMEATISFILFFCIGKRGAISAMHVQRVYNSATYFQLRDGTAAEPLTRDPTQPDPDTF